MTIAAVLPAAVGGLFAAGFDWLEALLPFLFVAFWIVSQVIAAIRRLGNGPRPARPLPRFDPARDPRGLPRMDGGDPADARAELDRQIAEFLRDMTERKQRPPGRAAADDRGAGPAAPRPQTPAGGAPQPAGRGAAAAAAARKRTAPPAPAAKRQPSRAPTPAMVSAAAAEPAASVAAHVSEVFGREMAHLRGDITGDAAGARVAVAPSSAQQLVKMLRDPQTVRQLVLLREVFERPVDRW